MGVTDEKPRAFEGPATFAQLRRSFLDMIKDAFLTESDEESLRTAADLQLQMAFHSREARATVFYDIETLSANERDRVGLAAR